MNGDIFARRVKYARRYNFAQSHFRLKKICPKSLHESNSKKKKTKHKKSKKKCPTEAKGMG